MAKTVTDPIHPGEILLEEFLKSYNPPVSQTDAADRLGWTFVRLNQFVNGKRAVTAANAIARAHQLRVLQCLHPRPERITPRGHRPGETMPRC